jgi:hypothetical protein
MQGGRYFALRITPRIAFKNEPIAARMSPGLCIKARIYRRIWAGDV